MELKCPKCGIRMHSLECFSDSCNWKPSIAEQYLWQKEQREMFKRQLETDDYIKQYPCDKDES
jgi:hypothetical protein